jgi:hypothetical protein
LGKIDLPSEASKGPNKLRKKEREEEYPLRRRTTCVRAGRISEGPGGQAGGGARFLSDVTTGEVEIAETAVGSKISKVKEIDKKKSGKIRQTQAKLAGTGGRGKSLKAKYRRAKREEMAEQTGTDEATSHKLRLPNS